MARLQISEGTFCRRLMIRDGDIQMRKLLVRFADDETAATAIEYGLIAGLIAVVIIGAVSKVGTRISAKFNAIAANLS
jgi:pilus assembly protein Flp/PilA